MITDCLLSLDIPKAQIKTEPDTLNEYGRDWTGYYKPNASAVVFPKSTEEVKKIVDWARKNRTALIPSGGRTGLSAAAFATKGEVIVSLEQMNKVLEFNPTNQTILCQAGVITENLQNYAKEQGYYFPVDFASRGSSQIGGNIATNAGGIKVIRYGLMRDWVAALTVVTGTGDILQLNNSLVKNASGYDFRHLFIGSEGTLGIVTEATLKVTRQPRPLHVMVLGVPDLASIMKVFSRFRDGTDITAFELFSDLALKHVLAQGHVQKPFATHSPYYILVEFEETSPDAVENALSVFEKCTEDNLIVDGVLAQSEVQARNFWRLREDISEATVQYTPYKNDISVTIAKVPEFVEAIDQVLTRQYPTFEVVWFGHIGDGNLHINILKPTDWAKDAFLKECKKVDDILFSTINKFSGSISAEHGVGLTKKPFLHYTRSRKEIEFMVQIKKVFDPDSILNPGKIFDC